MVRTTACCFFTLLAWGVCAFAEETAVSRGRENAPVRRWVVETDETSAAESLNRITGQIDTGFLSTDSDQAYGSPSHTPISPFARQQQAENGLSY